MTRIVQESISELSEDLSPVAELLVANMADAMNELDAKMQSVLGHGANNDMKARAALVVVSGILGEVGRQVQSGEV